MRASDTLRRISDDLWSASALLTLVPVPDHRPRGAASAWVWPLIGAGVAGVCAAMAWAALSVGLPPGLAAVVVLAGSAILTGGLHEDGLADAADGLFGGRTPDRRLEIMKDSRIGSYGALALTFVMLAKWSVITALLAAAPLAGLAGIVATAALSRAAMAVLMAGLAAARRSGLSQLVGRPTVGVAALACTVATAIGWLCVGETVLPMLVTVVCVTVAAGLIARARIGGQTGDILGATQQLTDLAALCAVAAALT